MTVPLRFPHVVPPVSQESRLQGRTYTPGFTDALGDRFLARGSDDEPVLEVLKFKPELSDSSDFEKALRARVEVVRAVKHHSIAAVHAVERPDGIGLCLISEHIEGRRLSELGPANLGPAFALEVIRTVTPVLSVLNQAGVGVADGTLSADRIVVAADGRLVVVEHVLGWAIESLRFSRQQLNDLGIVLGASDRFDGRTDMMQLGFLALSLLLRRRLDPADCPAKVPALLDESDDGAPIVSGSVRVWLERAMQIGPRPFASAHEAVDSLDELQDEPDVLIDEANALLEFPEENPAPRKESPAAPRLPVAAPPRETAPVMLVDFPAVPARALEIPEAPKTPVSSGGLRRVAVWILGAVSILALGEAIAIMFLSSSQTVTTVTPPTVAPSAEAATPGAEPPQSAQSTSNRLNPPTAPRPARSSSNTTAAAPVPAATTRFGSLRMTSAIALQVFQDGQLIGTTAGPITLREGTHQLQVVNDTLDFRLAQAVRIKGGQQTSSWIPIPSGKVSLNATPWAEVTIDGTAVGQTPIANHSLAIGTHEIVFRHPQLGVRRQTVVVKVGAVLRVTEAFQ